MFEKYYSYFFSPPSPPLKKNIYHSKINIFI
jgi:hypothetical protein